MSCLELLNLSFGQSHAKGVHEAFCKALEYRESKLKDFPVENINSKLADCFTSSGAKECVTLSEMIAIKNDARAVKVHTFLVGDRVLPESQKENFFWPRLLQYAYNCLYEESLTSEGLEIFKHALSLELAGQLRLGLALGYMYIGWERALNIDILHHTKSLIASCAQVLMKSDRENLTSSTNEILDDFAQLLFNLAVFNSAPVILDSILTSIIEVIQHIHWAPQMQQECVSKIPCVAHAIVDRFAQAVTGGSFNAVKYVVSRLLRVRLCLTFEAKISVFKRG